MKYLFTVSEYILIIFDNFENLITEIMTIRSALKRW